VWARVGQIAVILTALWTILQIYTYFYSKDAQIEATAEFGAFSPPDAWVQQLLNVDKNPSIAEIVKLVPKEEKISDDTAFNIKSLFREQKPSSQALVDQLIPLKSYTVFTITNSGNREAQDIKVELPGEGFYTLDRAGEPRKVGKFDHVIAVGNLHPGNELILTSWNDVSMDEGYYRRRSRVSHTNGVATVEFVPQLEGFEWLFHQYPLVLWILLLGWTLFVGILGYRSGKQSHKSTLADQDNKDNPADTTNTPASSSPS